MPEVVCIGELLVDFVSTKKGVSLRDAPAFAKAPGGAPANVAAGLAKLGRRVSFIGKVGNDAFGDFLKATLDEVGVDTSGLLRDPEVRTTLAFVAVDRDGNPDFSFYRNPGADMMLRPEEINPNHIRAARALCHGSVTFSYPPSRHALRRAIEIATEAGLMIVYDPNVRLRLWPSEAEAREWVWAGFDTCDFAKVSEEELEFITGTRDFEKGARMFFERGVKLLAISLGPHGCYYTNGRCAGHLPGYQVTVAEATGAGDAFVAAALDGLLRFCPNRDSLARLGEESIRAILDRANRAGALACTKVGAIPGLPTAHELDSARLTPRL